MAAAQQTGAFIPRDFTQWPALVDRILNHSRSKLTSRLHPDSKRKLTLYELVVEADSVHSANVIRAISSFIIAQDFAKNEYL
jgi:hypothetical protein